MQTKDVEVSEIQPKKPFGKRIVLKFDMGIQTDINIEQIAKNKILKFDRQIQTGSTKMTESKAV